MSDAMNTLHRFQVGVYTHKTTDYMVFIPYIEILVYMLQ